MTIHELIFKNRSYRRFHEDHIIERDTLVALVDLARHSASAGNKQPLKFFLSCDPDTNATIFSALKWAGYLEDWSGPELGERPSAYIAIVGDNAVSDSFNVDHGIAAQSMLLGAVELGLGGCIIASVQRVKLQRELGFPDHYQILLVVALGKPKEIVVIEPLAEDGDIRYWRDENGVHHVPKRSLEELIIQ